MVDDEKFDKLRKEAEDRLMSLSQLAEVPSKEDIKKLVHELQVHQIELEMQNQELRDAQNRLEESRDKYADLFEFAPVGYFVLDKHGIVLNCNLTACTMLGIERSKLIKMPFSIFIGNSPEQILTFRRYMKRVFKSDDSESCELLLKHKNDSYFMAHLETLKINDDEGNPTQLRMSVTDITKEKKVENMSSLLQAVLHGQESERERIAAELHDSINPLLSIASLNVSSMLDFFVKNKDFPKDKLDNTISILENAMRGIKEISGNLSPALLKSFGLSKALGQLCKRVRDTGKFDIKYLPYNMEDRMEFEIELALYRIAQELLNNIIKHASAKEVELQLVRHRESIVMMVSDNGVGFDETPEVIKTNGFGFKNINLRVRSLDGVLSIDSSKGKGTTVTIELPI